MSDLPGWTRGHLHPETLGLIYAWLERRSKGGHWKTPLAALQSRLSQNEDAWKVEEMGWALLEMAPGDGEVLIQYLLRRKSEWKTYKKVNRITHHKVRRLLLELQDNARRRGLLAQEDEELKKAAVMTHGSSCSSDGNLYWMNLEEASALKPLDGGQEAGDFPSGELVEQSLPTPRK